MAISLLISAVLFLAALALVLANLIKHRRSQRLVAQRLQGQMGSEHKLGNLMRQLGNSPLAQRSVSLDNETQTLLNRVGWRQASQRSMFAAIKWAPRYCCWASCWWASNCCFPTRRRRGWRP